jgi:hypothetical protein
MPAAGIEGRLETHLERLVRVVHRQLLHDVDEHHAVTALAAHGVLDVEALRLGQLAEVELGDRLVVVADVELVLGQLPGHVARVVPAVRDGRHHGVGDVADTTEPCGLEGQVGGRDIDTHAADHQRHVVSAAQREAEVVEAFHRVVLRRRTGIALECWAARPPGGWPGLCAFTCA